jgi:hypothetical protein
LHDDAGQLIEVVDLVARHVRGQLAVSVEGLVQTPVRGVAGN